ncbi:hypothetical protein BRADI_1g33223v3 [Brachypodium distachyon]|uniref:Protein kinase domain-containing protein n=1 Tax=Brachypodium distachyon TaxID=15368 RepID=A0A0Q3H2Z1_BRADI|nr:hypothetical protein BRADI_1g33223v3 [Brachypodium distachyon]
MACYELVGACSYPLVMNEFPSRGSLREFLRKLDCKNLPLEKIIYMALDIATSRCQI